MTNDAPTDATADYERMLFHSPALDDEQSRAVVRDAERFIVATGARIGSPPRGSMSPFTSALT
jgi:hypothetical protein